MINNDTGRFFPCQHLSRFGGWQFAGADFAGACPGSERDVMEAVMIHFNLGDLDAYDTSGFDLSVAQDAAQGQTLAAIE